MLDNSTYQSALKTNKIITILSYSFIVFWVLICMPLIVLYFNYQSDIIRKNYSFGKNALWARHQWVGEKHTEQEYKNLCFSLQKNQISDVYFHVGPLNAEGKIEKEKYLYAKDLVENFNEYCPEVHIHGWIGQVEKKGGGPLDLSDEKIRDNIVKTANQFIDLGFDGAHYNIEPMYSGDQNFLDLLKQTKKSFEERAENLIKDRIKNNTQVKKRKIFLSVAADELEPFYGAETLARQFSKQAGFWNQEYYEEISKHVDQIAIMMYDTALQTDWLYGNFVKKQTEDVLQIVPDEVTVFMGVPTYEDEHWGFHSEAENMASGIRGIQKGLENIQDDKRKQNFGAAIYAEWVTDENEWKIFEEEWLGE